MPWPAAGRPPPGRTVVRLTTAPANHRRRWHGLALLGAAAAALLAFALALNPPPRPAAAAPPFIVTGTSGIAPRETADPGVPAYYVAFRETVPPSLTVVSTRSGKQAVAVSAPLGVTLEALYGQSADDRSFAVAAPAAPRPSFPRIRR